MTSITGFVVGVHPEPTYKRLEAAHDGVVDFKIEEAADETRSLMRVRSMRNLQFDSRWHRLKTGYNFEVAVEK